MAFNFYANTPDSELIYFGDDPIVWDRINAERLRRGLPPLPNPRPGDGSPSAVPSGAVPPTPAAAQNLRQAEAQRESLIRQISAVEAVRYANEQTLMRRQQDLAQSADPQQRAQIQSQIQQLDATISQQQAKLAPLESQLTQVDQQVNAALAAAYPGAAFLPQVPGLPELPDLAGLPVGTAVSAAGLLSQLPSSVTVPGLGGSSVTGLLTSAASTVKAVATATGQAITSAVKAVGSTVSQITAAVGSTVSGVANSVGIGDYGITPSQLENQGYLKPGTVETFMYNKTTPEQIAQVLDSPTVWTGRDAVTSAQQFASNPNLQSLTQQDLLAQGAAGLESLGITADGVSAQDWAGAVQNATKYGPDVAAAWAKGQAPADLLGGLNATAKDAQFAVNLAGRIPTLGAITPPPEGAVGTVSRASVDTAVAGLLGNPKIPLPSFGTAGVAAAASSTSSLYSSASDQELIYTGDDYIVWDRVNSERLRRGLPSLSAIGYPRPAA